MAIQRDFSQSNFISYILHRVYIPRSSNAFTGEVLENGFQGLNKMDDEKDKLNSIIL